MGGMGGDDLKLEEEVIIVLGEWGYLQEWDQWFAVTTKRTG